MENKELETWLQETKAKNLSKEELKHCIILLDNESYIKLRKELKVVGTLYEHLFKQWQKEAKFSPKRGDRVLVWDDENEEIVERFFLTEIKGTKYPFNVVRIEYENEFINNKIFDTTCYKHMKPLPTEQPKKTDFKSQVIELIEGKINATTAVLETIIAIQKDLLEQVKNIC
jgi:hypothetical protein